MMSLSSKTQGCSSYQVAKVKGFFLSKNLCIEGTAHTTKAGRHGCKVYGIPLLSTDGRGDVEYRGGKKGCEIAV